MWSTFSRLAMPVSVTTVSFVEYQPILALSISR